MVRAFYFVPKTTLTCVRPLFMCGTALIHPCIRGISASMNVACTRSILGPRSTGSKLCKIIPEDFVPCERPAVLKVVCIISFASRLCLEAFYRQALISAESLIHQCIPALMILVIHICLGWEKGVADRTCSDMLVKGEWIEQGEEI